VEEGEQKKIFFLVRIILETAVQLCPSASRCQNLCSHLLTSMREYDRAEVYWGGL